MKIAVKYLAQLKKAAGMGIEDVAVDPGCSVANLVRGLAANDDGTLRPLLLDPQGRPHASLLIFVGDEQVRAAEDRFLREGDVVTLLTPMAGG
ncbi:MAG: MoaD/ThiS family protein [Planctomycetes bacterium]|nr:MoaD/ThiS family protein [Planctomycetota bacterium]